MSAVHLFAVAGTFGDSAMCGLWEPEKMSGDVADVTCRACKRSRTYKAVMRGDYSRPRTVQAYRKGMARAGEVGHG